MINSYCHVLALVLVTRVRTCFLERRVLLLGEFELLESHVHKVLETVEQHADKILQRWHCTHTTAGVEQLVPSGQSKS